MSADTGELARIANEASSQSRRRGAPTLRSNSSHESLLEWLTWADPNGIWNFPEELEDADLSTDDLWDAVESVLESW